MVSPENNVGATFFFEGWYVVRDAINPYNSMASVPFTPTWYSTNLFWAANAEGTSTLGPVIDRWVDPLHPAPGTMSRELQTPQGRIKVAVRTTALPEGRYRYDYAVMNVDFAIAKVSGKAPNLKILSSHGLSGIEMPLPTGAHVVQPTFVDSEGAATSAWTATVGAERIRWRDQHANELTWGSLYRFSFETDGAPAPAKLTLFARSDRANAEFVIDSLGPTSPR